MTTVFLWSWDWIKTSVLPCSSCSCWWCCSYSLFLRVCQESNCRTALNLEDWGHNPYIPVDLKNTTRGKLYDFCVPLQRTHKKEKAAFWTQRSWRHNFLRAAGIYTITFSVFHAGRKCWFEIHFLLKHQWAFLHSWGEQHSSCCCLYHSMGLSLLPGNWEGDWC